MVAAWIKAETGVGPSIAIGNQTCNPTCELLAIVPINKHTPTKIITLSPFYSESVIIFVGVCLLIGAMAKSSQVGLHV